MLRALSLSFAAAVALATAALADEVPFAAPPAPRPGRTLAALADIMGKIQLRHMKLWQAIEAKNWGLLDYELSQTRESFDTAVILYNNIPIELIVDVDKDLGLLLEAVKAKDALSLERGFSGLTAACNNCHQAAGVGFIVIKRPGPSPFTDQDFAPQK